MQRRLAYILICFVIELDEFCLHFPLLRRKRLLYSLQQSDTQIYNYNRNSLLSDELYKTEEYISWNSDKMNKNETISPNNLWNKITNHTNSHLFLK